MFVCSVKVQKNWSQSEKWKVCFITVFYSNSEWKEPCPISSLKNISFVKALRLTYCWPFQLCFTTYTNTTKAHPGQLLPFWQFLVLEWTPPPHSALQWAQGPHGVHRTGRGQGFFSLHSLQTNKPCVTPLMSHADDISSSKFKEQSHLSSRPWPMQTRPPCRGDGLLHDRCRTSNPMPQLLLHWLQEDQGVQPPFLRGMKEEVWIALNVTWEFNKPRFY